MRPKEQDLFHEEQSMPTMSFGDHIEELRVRLILALLGLFVGLIITFIPIPTPVGIIYPGAWVMGRMQDPARVALERFYTDQANRRATEARKEAQQTESFTAEIDKAALASALREIYPELPAPDPKAIEGQNVTLPMRYFTSDWITTVNTTVQRTQALISLSPLEGLMIFFMVSIVTGLVIASPWVFYQFWAFIAAGLYSHERRYVLKFLPFSLGLFLGGVVLCFFFVLPFTLAFLLDFNVWLGIEPMLRITDWISFATILPLVFGICFQTPLVMMILERVGIFKADDYRSKRKMAIMVIVVAAAVITPTGDPFTMLLLAIPTYALYELGIWMIPVRKDEETPVSMAG